MNNRIMAMLFALVAAMFISIVPVNAEAATCKHPAAKVEVIEAKEPTCNKKGNNQYYRCTACVTVYKDAKCTIPTAASAEEIPAKGHQWTWAETETGHIEKCTVSGCKATQSAAAHSYTYKAVDGKCVGTCGCGKVITADHVDTNNNGWCDNDCKTQLHDMVKIEAKAAECEKTGIIEHYYCKICTGAFADADGKTKLDNTVVEALEHKAVLEIDDNGHKAVCEICEIALDKQYAHDLKKVDNEDGTHTVTCETCGYEKTAAHDDGSKKDCVCGVCNAQMEHQLGEYTAHPSDATKHYRNCTVCRKTIVNEKCTFEYTQLEYGLNQHKYECTLCGKFQNTAACFDEKDDHYCDGCGGHMKHDVTAGYMKTVHKTPTCTEDGIWLHYECKTCGLLIRNDKPFDGDKVNPATGHALNAKWEEAEDGAEHYQWCANNCGTKLHANGEAAVVGTEAHSHKEWYSTDDAHCEICAVCGKSYGDEKHEYTEVELAAASSTGTQRHKLVCECGKSVLKQCVFDENCVCTVCGAEKVHEIAALSTVPGAKDPTCTATGVKTHYECKTCKGIFFYEGGKCVKITAADTVIPALGHKWVAKGTDVADGKHVMKCDNSGCNKYTVKPHYTEDGDCYCDVANCKEIAHSHKHIYVAAVSATCTEEGTEAYYYYQDCGRKFDLNEKEITAPAKVSAIGHTPSGEWTANDDVHEELCEACGEVLESAEHVDVNNNNRCDDCDVALALELMPEQPATCTNIGYKACWVSPVSQRMYSDAEGRNHITSREVIPALGHEETGWVDMGGENHKMSCQRTGCTWSREETHSGENDCYCEVCGGYYEGHQLYLEEMVPATCAKAGTQAYYECECGDLFDMGYNKIEAPKAIATLKHDMDTTVKEDAKQNKHYIQCKDCDYRMYENHGMELSDPNKGNYHQWLCDCGELEIETHYDKNGDNKCDVCDHSMNSSTTTVEQHDNKTVYTGESGTVKPTKDWWWNWQELFTPSNSGGSETSGEEEDRNVSVVTPADKNSSNNGATNSGAATNGGNANNGTVTPPAGNENVVEKPTTTPATPSAPTANQVSVISQFITWFLGLFGF